METFEQDEATNWQKYPILGKELGQKLTTREVAAYLDLDEDTVRKYYREIGGIRPTGSKGRILFFEKNIVDALSRRKDYAVEHNEERTNSMARASSEERTNQTETFQNKKGGFELGSNRKKEGLGGDRHGIFNE